MGNTKTLKSIRPKRRLRIKKRPSEVVVDVIIYIILVLLAVLTIVPFMRVITISMAPPHVATSFGLHLWPREISWDGYLAVLNHRLIWTAYGNTIFRVITGTSLSMFLLVIGAYPLSKSYLPNRKLWTLIILFTMWFSGGMIPMYILVMRVLGIGNSIFALILPGAVSAFNLIVARNFFETIPESLEESARLDGAGDFRILFQIVVPLSKPVLATVGLWIIVGHWNAWFDSMIYMRDESRFVLQHVLRNILLEGQTIDPNQLVGVHVNTETMRMATIVVSTVPILLVYPFLQKYFVQGVMIGAVKG